jgi:O-antigen ligase
VGVVVSSDLRTALGTLRGFLIDPFLVALLAVRHLRAYDYPRLVAGLIVSATLVSTVSLTAAWLGLPWAVAADGRLLGLFGIEVNASPNYLAMWVAPAVAAGLAWLMIPPWYPKRWQALLAAATVLNLVAVLQTDSRAALATAILGGLIAAAVYYRSTLMTIPFAQAGAWAILGGLILFGATVVQPDFSLTPEAGGRITTSTNIRWEIWRTTGELIRQHPIEGLGLGDYQREFGALTAGRVNYPEFITPRALTPHNLWLNAWVQIGLIGLIGFIGLIGLAVRSYLRAEPSIAATLGLALLTTILLHGLVDTPAWKNDLAVLFWLALAGAALVRAARSDD